MLIILGIILLLFGSERLRHIARSVGRGLGEIQRTKEEIQEQVGLGQIRRMKADLMQDVRDIASDATGAVIDVTPKTKNGGGDQSKA
jgi:TatA/E family protein of Tat protein translocase